MPEPVEAEPEAEEPAPKEPEPEDPTPTETAPEEPTPETPAPADPAPEEPEPAEPAPEEPQPAQIQEFFEFSLGFPTLPAPAVSGFVFSGYHLRPRAPGSADLAWKPFYRRAPGHGHGREP